MAPTDPDLPADDDEDMPAEDEQYILQGHDLRSLGPSDSSDSGSDLLGPGQIDDDMLHLDRGTSEDSEGGHLTGSDPGASLGDLMGDSDSDRYGTGEHVTAGREPDVRIAADIAPDRIVGPEEAGLGGLEAGETPVDRGVTWPWIVAAATGLLIIMWARRRR